MTSQLEALAQSYSEQNEGVNINVTTIGSGQGSAGLQAKFSSGDAPAMMMLGGLNELQRYRDTLL
ncbi:extracellular solute-binding protein, partial [Salmonella enterica]|uniref:extracellular solute-binding protein n=1 Tax=Salmonella enterica TaxID=28901 RepID=UPI0034DE68BB